MSRYRCWPDPATPPDRHPRSVRLFGTPRDPADTLQCTVPFNLVHPYVGLRATITVSDGHFTSALDVSRTVAVADSARDRAGCWIPIGAPYTLTYPGPEFGAEEPEHIQGGVELRQYPFPPFPVGREFGRVDKMLSRITTACLPFSPAGSCG